MDNPTIRPVIVKGASVKDESIRRGRPEKIIPPIPDTFENVIKSLVQPVGAEPVKKGK